MAITAIIWLFISFAITVIIYGLCCIAKEAVKRTFSSDAAKAAATAGVILAIILVLVR